MTIDFNTMETAIIPNFKGGEKELCAQMFWDGANRIMHGVLKPGASIGEHRHETNSEILFVLSGNGTIIDDGVPSPISKGMCTYCPKGHSHSLVNTGTKIWTSTAPFPSSKSPEYL
jgi:Mannose-6-phosphate isomerase